VIEETDRGVLSSVCVWAWSRKLTEESYRVCVSTRYFHEQQKELGSKEIETYYKGLFPNFNFVFHIISYKTPFSHVSCRLIHAHRVFWNI